ncbi:MAG: serine/threonine protein kinase [Myxococcales bacterium]|nr:serine/threonine protein kinase [Myxococcales bacterium]
MVDEPRADTQGVDDATRVTGENSSSFPSERQTAPSSINPGDVLGDRYRVIERLGKGGMGEVFLAEHVAIGRPVAIKTLSGDFHERPELARRFLQEARTASQIRHRNVVDITDFGYTDRGAPFFVMELLEGEDLKSILRRERTLPWPRIVAIVTQVCAALGAAHARGVIHRDMKPDNVFAVRDGDDEVIKVLDFGIAKITAGEEVGEATRTGVLLGTPHYMSPEQAQDDPLDARSDVYAVGVLLFRMTTGRLPFRGKSFMKVLGQQINDAPPDPLELAPPGLLTPERAAIILRCLAKRPEERFQSAEELAATLRASLVEGGAGLAAMSGGFAGSGGYSTAGGSAPTTATELGAPVNAAAAAAPAEGEAAPATGRGRGLLLALAGVGALARARGGFLVTRGPEPASPPAESPDPKADLQRPPRSRPPARPLAPMNLRQRTSPRRTPPPRHPAPARPRPTTPRRAAARPRRPPIRPPTPARASAAPARASARAPRPSPRTPSPAPTSARPRPRSAGRSAAAPGASPGWSSRSTSRSAPPAR